MNLYQTDRNGYYLYTVIAQADPKNPGQFLIPQGCVTVAPPALESGFRNRWNWTNEEWETVPAAPEAPIPLDPTPEELLAIEREGMTLTFAQMLIGLSPSGSGWLTLPEVEGWLLGTLPAPVLAVIAQLPEIAQFPVKARAIRPSLVYRNDPTVAALGALQNKTPEEIDDFFRTYRNV